MENNTFYLGKLEDGKPFLYDSKNFTTHAICLGMTGSGKTGLGISILEEAGLDKIPAIIIDPKGDLTNLLLNFPKLTPEEFAPWVEDGDAKNEAKKWKEGLASFQESPDRIQQLKDSVEMTIYTPGSNAGVPLSILSSFTAPPKEDPEAFQDRVQSVVSSLLGLLGMDADPVQSKEHILISTLLAYYWNQGKDLDLTTLIGLVQNPPMDKIGAVSLDSFFPPKERQGLAMKLNHLLAAPGFQSWMEGEPLDIQNLLYTKSGKPKFAIMTIAHLSFSEQMFFVTLLLNEFLSWMRRQSGSSNLKTLLYMDEIFGFFPPLSNPPSKIPMLRLLKTARAFGAGIILSTQNPVDLDYKGLSNCGTWFIGKLQTERDRGRVLEGLKNASIETKALTEMLGSIATRNFILRSIYEKSPLLFKTRWTLSYLRGPLTLAQIQLLTGPKKVYEQEPIRSSEKPLVPSGITEYYLNGSKGKYEPELLGIANLHFVDAKNKVDLWKEICMAAPFEGNEVIWEKGMVIDKNKLEKAPSATEYGSLPSGLDVRGYQKGFSDFLYQNETLAVNGQKDSAKIVALKDKIRRTEEKIAQKQRSKYSRMWDAFLSFLKTILGAFLGRGITKGTISNAETSLGKFGKIGKDGEAANSLEQQLEAYKQELEELQKEDSALIRPRKSDIKVEKIALLWRN